MQAEKINNALRHLIQREFQLPATCYYTLCKLLGPMYGRFATKDVNMLKQVFNDRIMQNEYIATVKANATAAALKPIK